MNGYTGSAATLEIPWPRKIYGVSGKNNRDVFRNDPNIIKIQEKLNQVLGITLETTTGIFGKQTEAAVIQFQGRYPGELGQDGRVGERTWIKLFSQTNASSTTSSPASAMSESQKERLQQARMSGDETEIANLVNETGIPRDELFRQDLPNVTSEPVAETRAVTPMDETDKKKESAERIREAVTTGLQTPEVNNFVQSALRLRTNFREILGDSLDKLTDPVDKAMVQNFQTQLGNEPANNIQEADSIFENLQENLNYLLLALNKLASTTQNPFKKVGVSLLIRKVLSLRERVDSQRQERTKIQNTIQQVNTRESSTALEQIQPSLTAPSLDEISYKNPLQQSEPSFVNPFSQTPAQTSNILGVRGGRTSIRQSITSFDPQKFNKDIPARFSEYVSRSARSQSQQLESTTQPSSVQGITAPDATTQFFSTRGGTFNQPLAAALAPLGTSQEQLQNYESSSSQSGQPRQQALTPNLANTSATITPASVAATQRAPVSESVSSPIYNQQGMQQAQPQAPMIFPIPINQGGQQQAQTVPMSGRSLLSINVRHENNSYERNMLMNLGRAFGYQ